MKKIVPLFVFAPMIYFLTTSYNTTMSSNFGATFQNGCSCHGSANTATNASIQLTDLTTNAVVTDGKFVAGRQYKLELIGTNTSNLPHFGFQLTTQGIGTLTNTNTTTQGLSGSVLYHKSKIAIASNQYTASATWTAPTSGSVTFKGVVNAVNGNSSDNGDKVSSVVSATYSLATTTAATVTTLDCGSAYISTGSLDSGVSATSVGVGLPYSGGNGGTYTAQTIPSTGVTGLTASLVAGSINTGTGNLILNITGTPASSGTATFPITFGGKTCSINVTVKGKTSGIGNTLNTLPVSIFSSPNSNTIQVAFTNASIGNYTVQFMDMSGKLISTKSFQISNTSEVYNVQKPSVQGGVYFMIVQNETARSIEKVIF